MPLVQERFAASPEGTDQMDSAAAATIVVFLISAGISGVAVYLLGHLR